jgi:hypothetical protein
MCADSAQGGIDAPGHGIARCRRAAIAKAEGAMNTALLQPPRLTTSQEIESERRQWRIERAYNEALNGAMNGSDDIFWADCHQSVYDAVREAMGGTHYVMSAEWFKATISMAVRLEAEKYATAVCEDVD